MSVAVGEVRYIKGKYYLMDLERAYPLRLKTDTIVRVTRIGTRQQYLLPSQGKDVRVDTVATAGGDDPGMWAWYTRKALRAALVAGELDDRSGLHPCPANYQFVVQEFGPDHLYRRPAKYRGGDFRPFEGEPHPSTGLYQLVVLERTFVCHIIHHGYQRSDTTPTCLRVMEVYDAHLMPTTCHPPRSHPIGAPIRATPVDAASAIRRGNRSLLQPRTRLRPEAVPP
jgi:hypothetical protein